MPTVTYTVVNGELLSENRSGTKRDYVPDPLGSTVALLDSSQTKTDTWTYWPYGEVKTRTGTNATPFQFVGTFGYFQDTSNRTYARARILRVTLGRWLTEDPIGFRGRDTNLHRYVANRPTFLIDPKGLRRAPDPRQPAQGPPAVYVCDSMDVIFPGFHHSWISTSGCGAWEYNINAWFPGSPCSGVITGPGLVRPVNDKLAPLPGYPGWYIPGQPANPWYQACHLVSRDPQFESAVCKCIGETAANPPIFFAPVYNCQSWVGTVLGCGCEAIGATYWYMGGCATVDPDIPWSYYWGQYVMSV